MQLAKELQNGYVLYLVIMALSWEEKGLGCYLLFESWFKCLNSPWKRQWTPVPFLVAKDLHWWTVTPLPGMLILNFLLQTAWLNLKGWTAWSWRSLPAYMVLWKDDEGCFCFHSGGAGTAGRLKNAGLKGIATKMVWSLGLPSSYRKNLELLGGIFLVFPFRQTHHLPGRRIFITAHRGKKVYVRLLQSRWGWSTAGHF